MTLNVKALHPRLTDKEEKPLGKWELKLQGFVSGNTCTALTS